jgi:hypothetical protein
MKQTRWIPVAIFLSFALLMFYPAKVQTPSAHALPVLNAAQGDECTGNCGKSQCSSQCASDCGGCDRSACKSDNQDNNCPGGCGQEHCSGSCVADCSGCSRFSCNRCRGGCGRSGDDCKALCNGKCQDGCDNSGCGEDSSAKVKCCNGSRKTHVRGTACNRGCGCRKLSRNS